MRTPGIYGSYAELAIHERKGRDYRVRLLERPDSDTLIAAPHGGLIETGTSEIAHLIAGTEYNLFCFEGLKPYGENRVLHITSHRFDHPDCLYMAARCARVLTVHGCQGAARVHVGGLDRDLGRRLARALLAAGFAVEFPSRRYPGRHPQNICNRGARARGAQLEVTYDLRAAEARGAIARAARQALGAAAGR